MLTLLGCGPGQAGPAAGGGSSATFDPANHASNVTLSNGNLTVAATVTDANGNIALSTTSHSGGKFYVTVHIDFLSGPSLGIGVANASQVVANSHFLGEGTNSLGWYDNGKWWFNGTGTLTNAPTLTNGATAGLAVDITTGKGWITIDGGSTWNNDIIANQNPATGTGGLTLPTGALFIGVDCETNGITVTANFGPGGGPSGFGNW